MQDPTKIQHQIDNQVQHQEQKAALLQEQIETVTRNKDMAERELAKFRILREGFNIANGVLGQQFAQARQQEGVNPILLVGFEGAIGRMTDLIQQADMAIAKNEGTHMAFQTMLQHLGQQVQQAMARSQTVAAQGEIVVGLASRAPATTMEELIEGAGSGDKPIKTPKQVASKHGRRKKAK